MRLPLGRILAFAALAAMLGCSAVTSTATSASAKKGSSCHDPWMVKFDHHASRSGHKTDIYGDRGRISLRKSSDPFTDPQVSHVKFSWARKSGVNWTCGGGGSIKSGSIDECSSGVTVSGLHWRIKPGRRDGYCNVTVPAGGGNDLLPTWVAAARNR